MGAKIPFKIPLASSSSRHNESSPCNFESSAFSEESSKAPTPNLNNNNTTTTEKAGSKEGRRRRYRAPFICRRHKEAFRDSVLGKKYHSTTRGETIPSRLRSGYGGDGNGRLLLPSQVAAVPSPPVDLRAESFLILNI